MFQRCDGLHPLGSSFPSDSLARRGMGSRQDQQATGWPNATVSVWIHFG